MKELQHRGLAPYHTFGIAADAKHIMVAESAQDLLDIWQAPQFAKLPKLLVGQGSNLLFCEDYSGVVVLNRIAGITVAESDSDYLLHVGGGEDWHQLVQYTVEQGMPGLENLALIPGCVGSSPIQNIGAYGVELKDVCDYVDVVELTTGVSTRLSVEDCQFGYRDSIFKHQMKDTHAITAVGFRLTKAWQPKLGYGALAELDSETATAQEILDKVCAIRMAKLPDPKQLGNAGSFFKNPIVSAELFSQLQAIHPNMPAYPQADGTHKLAAGWLIDQAALKGYRVGGAQVHQQQALVLVNTGSATAQDVINLAAHVVDTVKAQFGVELEHEVRFMSAEKETYLSEVQG